VRQLSLIGNGAARASARTITLPPLKRKLVLKRTKSPIYSSSKRKTKAQNQLSSKAILSPLYLTNKGLNQGFKLKGLV